MCHAWTRSDRADPRYLTRLSGVRMEEEECSFMSVPPQRTV